LLEEEEEEGAEEVGTNLIVTLEKQLLNMIGNLA
jgi:hypothetical protein